LLVEADDKASLSRGIMGVTIRMARAVNRVLERRGNVWSERYHSRALKTPREVRNAIVYVLMNRQKHASKAMANALRLDPCSSASLFDGWKVPPSLAPPRESPTEPPTTWLLRLGWKRHGLIGLDERPKHSL
jgi:hypothetical protein